MKSISIPFAVASVALFLCSCQSYGPQPHSRGGSGVYYGNDGVRHPNHQERYKNGKRSYAEKKYMRPR